MVSIRVVGEDDAVAFARGEAEFELDGMTLVTPLRRGVGYDKQFVAIIDSQEMAAPGVTRI